MKDKGIEKKIPFKLYILLKIIISIVTVVILKIWYKRAKRCLFIQYKYIGSK